MDKFTIWVESYGQRKLAYRLGLTEATISGWKHKHWRIPAERCREIVAISKGALTVHDLRPDVFGD
mgnify:CR=1 FL=1